MNAQTLQKTVLVVDDVPASMDVLVQALTRTNFRVLIAENGQQALEVLQRAYSQQILPDIILLDVAMPGMDGFETCRQMKATPALAHIPVLFVTAHDQSLEKVRGFDVGAADYISKPLDLAEVQARINTHVTMSLLQQQLQAQNASLTQELQAQIVQLRIEADAREQATRELERLLEERNKLLEVVGSQSDQLSEVTANVIASQNEQRQSLLRLLGEQVQEKLSRLRVHLDAAHADLDPATSQGVSVADSRALEHLNASLEIAHEMFEQTAQLLTDLEQQTNVFDEDDPLLLLSAREREVLTLIG